jgi:hypothetical protein
MRAGLSTVPAASSRTAPCIWPDRPTQAIELAGTPLCAIADRIASWHARHQSAGSCSAQVVRGDANGA